MGGFNSITKIFPKSNITFWQDWYWGKYYSINDTTTLGLNDVEKTLVTLNEVYINITGQFGASASFIMNNVIKDSVVRVTHLQMNSSLPHIMFKPVADADKFDFGGIIRTLK